MSQDEAPVAADFDEGSPDQARHLLHGTPVSAPTSPLAGSVAGSPTRSARAGDVAGIPALTEAEAQDIASEAQDVIDEIATVVEGKKEVAQISLLVLLAGGHLLIEDIPGVGKTMLAKSLAATLGAERHRIQFTPDLLPGDVTGASVFNQSTGEFEFRRGAVFTQILLADEINRASPKTQSALLEAMEERQVSVDGATYELAEPFMVVATANPVEMEGTYRLPEAQRDRFLAQTSMGYPVAPAESRMLAAQAGPVPAGDREILDAVTVRTTPERIAAHVRAVRRVHASPLILDYVVRLADATRTHPQVTLGASPRAGVHLVRAAKAHAALAGRTFVGPEDVRAVIMPVWRHRMHLTPQALSRGASAGELVDQVLRSTSQR
ncbi:AAA family ATPase [Brachybacterium sacelli]|uniref:MoxR-like ATPase n=1 Tax=Brachybacterium sacelli TaxID=173364 RepID=A0ABS4WVB6_9MICO|nr:MoxR family ATPase [Brachybacterium sacelli]MBP2380151.1 MoxR-like ATPase [Brachybacterium sacelli]